MYQQNWQIPCIPSKIIFIAWKLGYSCNHFLRSWFILPGAWHHMHKARNHFFFQRHIPYQVDQVLSLRVKWGPSLWCCYSDVSMEYGRILPMYWMSERTVFDKMAILFQSFRWCEISHWSFAAIFSDFFSTVKNYSVYSIAKETIKTNIYTR